MTGLPTVQVLLDNGTGTFPYDVSTKARVAYGFNRGRQDEQAQVTPGQLALILDNNDGRFTLGSTTIASPSPVKVDQRIRVKVLPDSTAANLLSAADSSFEAGIGTWAFNTLLGARTAGTSLASSAVRSTVGTKSLLITWSTSAIGNFAGVAVTTVVGQAYTFACDIFVPAGSPDVGLAAVFATTSQFVTVKDTWVRASVSWVATSTSSTVGIDQVASTVGQTCFVDNAVVSTGSANRFTGYVQQWPVEWPTGSNLESLVAVLASDAQARAERTTLRSIGVEEILEDSASLLYVLDEEEGSVAAGETSGNQGPSLGIVEGPGGTDVIFGGSAVAFVNGGDYLSGSTLRTTTTGTWVVAFKVTAGSSAQSAFWGLSGGISGVLGMVPINQFGSAIAGITAAGAITDNVLRVGHLTLAAGTATLYLDGVSQGSAAVASITWADIVGLNITGAIHHAAFFPTALSAARVAAQASAILNGLSGESGTARITRLAGYRNLPVGTLDASLTNVAAGDTEGKSAGEQLRQAASAEMGLVFVDGSGSLTFHNRNRPVAKTTPDVTITADVCDPGTRFDVDMQGVINYFEASRQGGPTQIARNSVSELGDGTATNPGHGRYSASETYLVLTDQEALDRANWIIYTHAEPSPRLGTLTIDLMALDAAAREPLLTAEPNTWIRVTGLPSQTPGGTTADLVVQGFSESLTKDSWSITFNVANKALFPTPWILDSATYSVLDSTTRVFV